jgi:oxygen-independent coproporphyrinogen-3 oxidase
MNKDILSLYIHIPFCNHICDYCDFPKLQYFRFLAEKYLESLEKEIKQYSISTNLETIYIGGGTPTALEDDLFEKLLKIVEPYSKNIKEYTVEANPESLTLAKLKLMRKYNINRISIGVESTNDKILNTINRHHTWEDVKTCISNAKKEGFDNLNVDLILGLPNVSKKLLKEDLDNLLSLDIQHISAYSLTVHPNTVFGIKNIQEEKQEIQREQYDLVHEFLKEKGFIHYEISNWAKQGYESLHNFTYWKDEQYYGVGLGAAGFIGNIRYSNTKSINKYIGGNFIAEQEIVSLQDDLEYFIMLNLRTNKGINLEIFKEKFGFNFYEEYKNEIDNFISNGFLVKENNSIIPTYSGMMILDTIVLELLKYE